MGSPVSPLVADLYMEYLEETAIAAAPLNCKPRLWKRYVDDILEVIKKQAVGELTEHLNSVDGTGSIKFTYESEDEKRMPFLDILIVRKPNGQLRLLVYRKKTHTDQYLNFASHHPLQHKLSVVRTLLTRCSRIITDDDDKKEEIEHIKTALSKCGYPDWCVEKVRRHMECEGSKPAKNKNKQTERKSGNVSIPYVKGLSEAITRVYKRFGISVSMRPVNTIRSLVVHPKDKINRDETGECVYRIPCQNCEQVYIGETGRSFGTRMKEHRTEVEQNEKRKFTRSTKRTADEEQSKSAITDHTRRENHVINWDEAKILDKESDRMTRWIREAIRIRKEKTTMNRVCGSYQLSHTYDTVLISGRTKATSAGKSF